MSTPVLEARIAHLEGIVVQVGERLNSIERRLDGFESRFERIDARFDRVDSRFDRIDERFDRFGTQMDQRFMWLTGIVVGTWITTILTVLFHR